MLVNCFQHWNHLTCFDLIDEERKNKSQCLYYVQLKCISVFIYSFIQLITAIFLFNANWIIDGNLLKSTLYIYICNNKVSYKPNEPTANWLNGWQIVNCMFHINFSGFFSFNISMYYVFLKKWMNKSNKK